MSAVASAQNQGFSLNRYEPTAAGEWSFAVDHPWYSSTRYFAAGVTLNYGHNPLVFGTTGSDGSFTLKRAIIGDQLIGHVDLAGSFLDRVTIMASLPIHLVENGRASPAGDLAPGGAGVGDPRLGLWVRVFGQPDSSAVSLSLGAQLYIPLRSFASDLAPTQSDQGIRLLPKLALAGFGHHLRWSFTGAFLYRPEARLGMLGPEGSTAGSELQFGASLSYADKERRFAVGPEAVLSTLLIPNNAFQSNGTSLELLLGGHYNVASLVQLGLAGGLGILREPGTPDFRLLFRAAYAPLRKIIKDRDKDGVPDGEDACIDVPGVRTANPRTTGCPPDRDGDGILDSEDLCPEEPQGNRPDPDKRGCPLPADRDDDGIPDKDDLCPEGPQGAHPDPERKGCPANDKDGDGVLDIEDMCLDTPQGEHPDPKQKGCPAGDKDKDGLYDDEDQCPEVPAGDRPDPQKKGCPLSDRDQDTVVDIEDACPDQAGAPNPDPKKNGCPGLVRIANGKINILQPVFFATNQDVILAQSFPLLESMTAAITASPQIKKIRIEGYTDNRGNREYNLSLSDRRAKSVLRWLNEHGIAESRLEAKGFGQDNPEFENKTAKGRAANRRVEFIIIDPPQPPSTEAKAPVEAPVIVDKEPGKKKGGKERAGKRALKGKKAKAP